MKTRLTQYLPVFLIALLGGFLGSALHQSSPAEAASQAYLWASGMSVTGTDGKQRLQLGVYDGSGEKGLPMVGLTDNHDRLRMLLRLAGNNESPVIVLKDGQGRDRLVLGLDLNSETEEPFLATFDAQGQKKMVFGAY